MIEFKNLRREGDAIVCDLVDVQFAAELEVLIAHALHRNWTKEMDAVLDRTINGNPGDPLPVGLFAEKGKR